MRRRLIEDQPMCRHRGSRIDEVDAEYGFGEFTDGVVGEARQRAGSTRAPTI